ncbi:unnamed protein product [Allacma fusca]|uniref:Kazal-like domain-containing protein n=1 Tax=Allacma fusca TaxID=39272 RepID=A0A8J2JRK3_9HEXA|nr:unnamed protein product [Allacma fusca]
MLTLNLLLIFTVLNPILSGAYPKIPHDPCDCPLANTDENLEEHSEHEKHLGLCASTGDRFLNKCWLKAYNRIFNKRVTKAPDSSCHGDCPCKACEDLPLYNPVCVFNPNTGNVSTILNHCDLQCQQCLHNVLVMHCGPCGVNCSEIFNRADCLAPSSNDIRCIIKTTTPDVPPNPEPCDCADKPQAMTCTYDTEGNMITFLNPCFVHCNPLFIAGGLKILYDQEGMGWCPCK